MRSLSCIFRAKVDHWTVVSRQLVLVEMLLLCDIVLKMTRVQRRDSTSWTKYDLLKLRILGHSSEWSDFFLEKLESRAFDCNQNRVCDVGRMFQSVWSSSTFPQTVPQLPENLVHWNGRPFQAPFCRYRKPTPAGALSRFKLWTYLTHFTTQRLGSRLASYENNYNIDN